MSVLPNTKTIGSYACSFASLVSEYQMPVLGTAALLPEALVISETCSTWWSITPLAAAATLTSALIAFSGRTVGQAIQSVCFGAFAGLFFLGISAATNQVEDPSLIPMDLSRQVRKSCWKDETSSFLFFEGKRFRITSDHTIPTSASLNSKRKPSLKPEDARVGIYNVTLSRLLDRSSVSDPKRSAH